MRRRLFVTTEIRALFKVPGRIVFESRKFEGHTREALSKQVGACDRYADRATKRTSSTCTTALAFRAIIAMRTRCRDWSRLHRPVSDLDGFTGNTVRAAPLVTGGGLMRYSLRDSVSGTLSP